MIPKDFSVEGNVAIVTGGGRGIGKAIALTLAEAGADISVVARTAKRIEQTAEEIRQLDRKALPISIDVTKGDQVKEAVEQTLSQWGKIDILVNSAGIGSPMKPVALMPKLPGWGDMARDTWGKQLAVEEWHQVSLAISPAGRVVVLGVWCSPFGCGDPNLLLWHSSEPWL